MKQLKCAFHPNNNLANFCRSPQCLLPMCSACVKIHTSEHIQQNTHGIYDCISDMQRQVQATLENALKSLITNGNDLKQIYKYRQTQRTLLMSKLKQIRGKILDTVNIYIDGVEQQIMTMINTVQNISNQQIAQVDIKIQKLSSQASSEMQTLNSQKQIKAIITHISSNMPVHYSYQLGEVSSKIQQIKLYQIKIQKQFKPSQIQELLKSIGEFYQTTFIQPIKRRSSRKFMLRESNITRISSSKDYSTFASNKKVL